MKMYTYEFMEKAGIVPEKPVEKERSLDEAAAIIKAAIENNQGLDYNGLIEDMKTEHEMTSMEIDICIKILEYRSDIIKIRDLNITREEVEG